MKAVDQVLRNDTMKRKEALMVNITKLFVSVGQVCGFGYVIDPEIRMPLVPSMLASGRTIGKRGARLQCTYAGCTNIYEAELASILPRKNGKVNTQSCGCYQPVKVSAWNKENEVTHGLARKGNHHPQYGRYNAIMARCYKETSKFYPYYGGRGIRLWVPFHDIRVFCKFMDTNLGPTPVGMSLDRINNDGHYEPNNLRWADRVTQRANQTRSGGIAPIDDFVCTLSKCKCGGAL